MFRPSFFKSFFIGGFESACQQLPTGKRLDMTLATGHDIHVLKDYARLQELGICTVREGMRWPVVEPTPKGYDFSSVLPVVRAAQKMEMQVIWDLCHFGWPDDIDVFKPAFVQRFARVARAFTQLLSDETDMVPFIVPVTEISFTSWAGGDVGYLNPFNHGRGFELKAQLARAVIAGVEAIWSVDPRARIIHPEPLISIVADPNRPEDQPVAEGHHQTQYQAWDMIAGRLWPQLGGGEQYLDILGINYYHNNQWIHNGPRLYETDPLYRPLSNLLDEVHRRYYRPMLISETSIEGERRPEWLRYVAGEVAAAMQNGVQLHGLCLYPVVDYPGWDNERYCATGLLCYPDDNGEREIHEPLAAELKHQAQNPVFQVRSPGSLELLDKPQLQKVLHLPRFDFDSATLSWDLSGQREQEIRESEPALSDLLCFSHLRWDFVYQRPQHLMARFARQRRVFFIEEPVFDTGPVRLEIRPREPGIFVVTPHIPGLLSEAVVQNIQRRFLDDLLVEYRISWPIAWYYTPMALSFSRQLTPLATIYDCMDELSLFEGAPVSLIQHEQDLFVRADLVFTGGYSLYKAKRQLHPKVYAFPSSVDVQHFNLARKMKADPMDQASIPYPRIGFYGVIDERIDLDLLAALADKCHEWQFVMIGPVIKIHPDSLPRRKNIHYLGARAYSELPAYLSGWDIAMMPFALNQSTRFISPTKTLEYLAGGKPVISTPIHDVIYPYGENQLVQIESSAEGFEASIERVLAWNRGTYQRWLDRVDTMLRRSSWDNTWDEMKGLVDEVISANHAPA